MRTLLLSVLLLTAQTLLGAAGMSLGNAMYPASLATGVTNAPAGNYVPPITAGLFSVWDADTATGSDGDGVCLQDSYGGVWATNANAAGPYGKPYLTNNAVNGHKALCFQASLTNYLKAGVPNLGNTNNTVFVVAKVSTLTASRVFWGATNGLKYFYALGNATENNQGIAANFDVAKTAASTSISAAMKAWGVFTCVNSNSATSALFTNGTMVAQGEMGTNAVKGQSIGAGYSGGALVPMDGWVRRVLFYTNGMSAADRRLVESNLYWDITASQLP